jgi:hypothetical protein
MIIDRNGLIGIALSIIYVVATSAIFINTSGLDVGICVVDGVTESQKTTVEFINGLVDLQMSLSTGIVALIIALLVGIQGNIRVTPTVAFVAFWSATSFGISILYGIWWKMHVANLWFNECLTLVGSKLVQAVNEWHFWYMIAGFVLIAGLVLVLTLQRISPSSDGR